MTHCRCQEKEKLFKNKYKNSARVHKDESTEYYTIHLSHKLKSDILINNIFGVDIDAQAVLVTKFSLSIKALEDSTHDEVIEDNTLFKMPTIPKLENNIKCGNSLIGSDFYIDNRPSLFNEKEKRKINTFHWDKEFPQVFNAKPKEKEKLISKKIDKHLNAAVSYLEGVQYHTEKAIEYAVELNNLSVKEDVQEYKTGYLGGFDVVIGNPPWVDLKGHIPDLIKYYFKVFKTAKNRINLYALFIEKGLGLLKNEGKMGMIIPNSLLYQSSYEKLRKIILDGWCIEKIIILPDNTFQNVKAESMIITLGNSDLNIECFLYEANSKIDEISKVSCSDFKIIEKSVFYSNQQYIFDIYSDSKIKKLLSKVEDNKLKLIELCDFSLGITPYDKYKGYTQVQIIEKAYHSDVKKDKSYKPLLSGSDVNKYWVKWQSEEFISYGDWLGAPREQRFFNEPRILIRQIISGKPPKIFAGYTQEELYNTQTIFNIIKKRNTINSYEMKFLLGIINSSVINFYHKYNFLDLSKNLFQKILIQNAKLFPIPIIDFTNISQKQAHDRLVKLVEQMMENQEYLHDARNESDKKMYKNITDQLDKQIDEIVYKLYDLTNDEIRIVEESN